MARRKKKKTLPLMILILIFWGALASVVIWVDPVILKDFPFTGSYFLFFLIWILAWFFLLALVLNHTRRAFFYSLAITIFMVLRLIKLANVVNLVLLVALAVVIDFYFANR